MKGAMHGIRELSCPRSGCVRHDGDQSHCLTRSRGISHSFCEFAMHRRIYLKKNGLSRMVVDANHKLECLRNRSAEDRFGALHPKLFDVDRKIIKTSKQGKGWFQNLSFQRNVSKCVITQDANKNERCKVIQDGEDSSFRSSLVFFAGIFVLNSTMAFSSDAANVGVQYDPSNGAETLKTIAGIGYIVLVVLYFVRLFKKRADRATSVSLTSSTSRQSKDEDDIDEESEDEDESDAQQSNDEVTPLQCLIGFVQAGTIAYLLYILSSSVDDYFAKQELPTQYTAHNIALLIQTVVRGLSYLVTFIFAANATGLALLGIQMALDPESVRENASGKLPKGQKLPNVKATDDIFSIRRAFKEAEQMGKQTGTERTTKSSDKR